MIRPGYYLLLLLSVFFVLPSLQAQPGKKSKKELDELKAKQAIMLIDNGQADVAIGMLKELQRAYPANAEYPYEIAYAYYIKKNYPQTISILQKQVLKAGAFGKMYHLLGNSYDNLKQRNKALENYQKGLQLFPGTGELYLEMGNIHAQNNAYFDALWYYEKGIESDPAFPSNYYKAAKIFLNSDEKVWGMIYGELFMNLERNSKRTSEMATLLYNAYKSQVKFTGDSITVNFSRNADIDGVKRNTAPAKPPFGISVYQPMLKGALEGETKIDVASLVNTRRRFLENYFNTNTYLDYPNVLFDYQYRVSKAGHLEAYSHWILMQEQTDEFKTWVAANSGAWDKFLAWFKDNGLSPDPKYKFFRNQY